MAARKSPGQGGATARATKSPADPWRAWGLWPHQVAAVESVVRYLADAKAHGQSALIRMPTGTGKTGVIATLAQTQSPTGDILVVTPWDALANQLVRDVGERFWVKVGHAEVATKPVRRFYPRNALEELDGATEPTVWVCTTATLQRLHSDADGSAYAKLASRVGLVMIDEGHYEPAQTWARAVRGLERPTVLLTATPYRNDYKFFTIDNRHTFQYGHGEAESEGYLRKPVFRTIDFTQPSDFCDRLEESMDESLDPADRVVVRCDSRASVQRVAQELQSRGLSFIALHEEFTQTEDDQFRRKVPLPQDVEARIWVHQFKLMEGIDEPRFRMLAVYEPITNERALVQQIGRVLRNDSRVPGTEAFVLGRSDAELAESWDAYIDYDRSVGSEAPPNPTDFALLQSTLYLEGKFRTGFDIDNAAIDDFTFPRNVRVARVDDAFKTDDFKAEVAEGLDLVDARWEEVQTPDGLATVLVYVALLKSPLLKRKAFIETKLGLCLFTLVGDLLFFWDSRGWAPESFRDMPTVEGAHLRRLYGPGSSLSEVSLLNLDVGLYSARRRSVNARDLVTLAPDLSEYAQFPSTVRGRAASPGQASALRYVGFSRGRITDPGTTDYPGFMAWVNDLAGTLQNAAARSIDVFNRWAEVVDSPAQTDPEAILLDFDPSEFEGGMGSAKATLDIDDVALAVTGGKFSVLANTVNYDVTIAWDSVKARYELTCPDLDRDFAKTTSAGSVGAATLVEHLNREQAFRIVTAGGNAHYTVYAGGTFSRPRLPLAGRPGQGLELMNVLTPAPELVGVATEKGDSSTWTSAGWDRSSLFGMIDKPKQGEVLHGLLGTADLIICDDMRNEMADFVALDRRNRRVVLIHAKAYSTHKARSATALHEVSGQVVKNLAYLHPFFVQNPPNLKDWDQAWPSRGGKVATRIRLGGVKGNVAWDEIRMALRDPSYTRCVWVVLGNGVSKNYLETQRTKKKTAPQAIQALYSLQSLWSSVSSIGAQLTILCTP